MERDGEGNETHTLYDGMGRKLALYTPKQWEKKDGKRTDYRYDFLARPVDTVYPDGSHQKLFRDGEGNILKEVHPNSYDSISGDGEGTRYDYDMENRLLRVHHPDGGTERFLYDAAGNRIKHVMPEQYDEKTDDGDGWTYAYDDGDHLVSITGPDGIVMASYAYDLWGNCVRKEDSDGHSTYYAYDLMGRLIRELAPVKEDQGHISYRMTVYAYDDDGNCIREIRHGGIYQADGTPLTEGTDLELAFAYDARGRLVKASDSQGARVSYRYDARGNRTSEEQIICAGEGRTVLRKLRYSYDRAGRLVKKTEILDDGLPAGIAQTPETAVTTYSYDANGNRTRITTPEGYQISYEYDDRDRLITEHVEDQVNRISRTTRITYDKAGNIISVAQEGKDGQSRKVSYDYDLKDRLTHAAELDGPVFDLSYDKNDQTAMQRRLLPTEKEAYSETSFHYDIRGRLTEKYQGGILIERNGYDIRGNRTNIMDGDGVEITCQYGIQNEQTEISTANSRKQGKTAQKLTYDARGRITGIYDGMGGKTGYALDGWGRIMAIHTPEGGQEQYVYDQAGNLITATDAKGGVISYAYNSRGQISAITDQGGDTETFRYDKEGRQVQHTDRNGTVTETKYNVYGQPVLQACTDKKGNRQVMGTWEYDDFGQLKKSVAGGFCYTYSYRPDGRLLKKWSSGKLAVSCAYYRDGSLKSLTDISGKTVYYGYDGQGRLTSLTDGAGKLLIGYTYTASGRLKEIQTQNGFVASYEYDDDGNLSHLRIGSGEDSLLYDAFLSYDLNGNRTGKSGVRLGVDGAQQEIHISYQYDCMGRLTEERRGDHGERYSYDLAGNRSSKKACRYALAEGAPVVDWEETYCYNEKNELTERKTPLVATRYLYDKNGSLVSVKEGGKATSYQYDLLNRQTSVQMPDGRVQENLYDGEGLRAGIRECGKLSTFLYYNGEILAECNGESMPLRRHLPGRSSLQTLEDGQYHACHQDEKGSTIYITGRDGAVENCYVYDAFGNTLEKKEGIQNRIQYTGQQYDQETGQYYLRARYYNPTVGRFTQEDTYRGDGLNLYAYCKNNPVLYYDPSGHNQVAKTVSEPEVTNTASVKNDYIYSGDLMSPEDSARYSEYWRSKGIGSDKTWNEFIAANPNGTIDDYFEILNGESPWPLGETGTPTTLKSGDRFFMAVENDAKENMIGGFGVKERINSTDFVRNNLAVKEEWKPTCNTIREFEVNNGVELNVNAGPVGPQIDLDADVYLPGDTTITQYELFANLGKDIDRQDYVHIVDEYWVD